MANLLRDLHDVFAARHPGWDDVLMTKCNVVHGRREDNVEFFL